ncbi:hypothetical protein E2C01_070967 [Portunus trituberculatus]|uniref:Uncharacterized protein n=1 Tax=Portunus trituberculatus TaxID=210409 RepID=A0A5B7HU52_PORTR|nr:hypothetical protein [Portunus trituberculatus]
MFSKSLISVLQKLLTQQIKKLNHINIFKANFKKISNAYIYGEKFVYGNKQLSEGEMRVARTRAEFALWSRQQAWRFAEAKKRPK